jgi:hypothetical protein
VVDELESRAGRVQATALMCCLGPRADDRTMSRVRASRSNLFNDCTRTDSRHHARPGDITPRSHGGFKGSAQRLGEVTNVVELDREVVDDEKKVGT